MYSTLGTPPQFNSDYRSSDRVWPAFTVESVFVPQHTSLLVESNQTFDTGYKYVRGLVETFTWDGDTGWRDQTWDAVPGHVCTADPSIENNQVRDTRKSPLLSCAR